MNYITALRAYTTKMKGSEPVETFGQANDSEPEAVSVDLDDLILKFKIGCQHFGSLGKEILSKDCVDEIERAISFSSFSFFFRPEIRVRILYELAATFHSWVKNRYKLIELATPLYYARVASFIRQTAEMTSAEAEAVVEEQAQLFEDDKDYLIKAWESKASLVAEA